MLVKKRIIFGTAIIFCIIAGVYLYAQYNPEDYSFFPQCPVYALTGYQCPGCGSQRAFYHLFHGHIQTAFLYNPLMIALAPYIILGVYLVFITDPMQPIAVRIRHIFFGKWALFTLAVIVVGYTIIRNL